MQFEILDFSTIKEMLLKSIEEFNEGFVATGSTCRLTQDEKCLKSYEVHMCSTKPKKIGKSKDLCRK